MDSREFVDMTAEELRTYMADHKEKDYVLIDVRQPKEYAQAHIPGAQLISLGELPARMAELPLERDIVFY